MGKEVQKSEMGSDDQRRGVQFLGQLCVSYRLVGPPERNQQVRIPLMRLGGLWIDGKSLSELFFGIRPLPISSKQSVGQRDVSLGQRIIELQSLERLCLRLRKLIGR